jgi:hypothetical protein
MRSQPTVDEQTMKFRAATLEEAIAAAERAIGGSVTVHEAHRIRRGGIGGFFATDLGVEVTVSPGAESIDEAIERVVRNAMGEELPGLGTIATPRLDRSTDSMSGATSVGRAAFARALGDADEIAFVTDDPDAAGPWVTAAVRSINPTVPPRPLRPALTDDDVLELHQEDPMSRRPHGLPTPAESMVDRIADVAELSSPATDRIIDELRTLAAPAAAPVRAMGPTGPSSTSPRRRLGSPSRDLLADVLERTPSAPSPAAAAAAAATEIEAIVAEAVARSMSEDLASPPVSRPAAPPTRAVPPSIDDSRSRESRPTRPLASVPSTPAPAVVSAPAPMPAVPMAQPVIEPAVELATSVEVEHVPAASTEVVAAPRQRPAGPPSRRHVELAIAAADQLIDSLSRGGNVQRLSIRVRLRSGDHREVEAEAQWEAQPAPIGATPPREVTL